MADALFAATNDLARACRLYDQDKSRSLDRMESLLADVAANAQEALRISRLRMVDAA